MMRKLFLLLIAALLISPVSAETLVVGSYEIQKGSTISIPIIAKNLSSIAGFDIKLNYNPDVIEFVSYSIGNKIGQNFNFKNIDSRNGTARFIIVANNAITAENITLINITFKAVGDEGSKTSLSLYAELSRVVNGKQTGFQTVIPECISGEITIKSKTETPSSGGSVSGGSSSSWEITTTSEVTPTSSPEITKTITTEKTPKSKITPKTTPTSTTETIATIKRKATLEKKGIFEIPGFETLIALSAVLFVVKSRKNKKG